MRPGPGTPPAEVARNQRERLFGAMVASVAERGYAATRLSDLVEISGVSGKSFYALFSDKRECFAAATEAIIGETMSYVMSPTGTWEEQVRGGAAAFAKLVVAQPAAARMCLIEAYAVGPTGLAPLEAAMARFETHALTAASEAGLRAEALPAMISAHVGALMEIARTRLRLGREAELSGLVEEFSDFVVSQQAPPQPLRLTARLPTPAPETLDAHAHAERVLRAFAAVAAEQGYENTTIDLILKRAAMSPTTFYANFGSKEEVLFAAIESGAAQLLAAVLPTYRRNPHWAHGVRGAFGDFFNFLASRPALAHLLMVEVYAAGPAALARREEALRPLEVLLAEGRARRQALGPIAIEAIGGGLYRLAYKQIREHGAESLPHLAPICAYMTLAPLIGAEEACVVANGDGRRRGALDDRRLLAKVLAIITTRGATPEEIAREAGASAERVRQQIAELEGAGLVAAVGDEEVYRPVTDWIEDDVWEQMSLAERQAVSAQVVRLVKSELDQAIELGTFDARVDRHLTRVSLLLDARGWRELMDVHYHAVRATIAVQAEAAERLHASGEPGITGSSVQMLFEVPRK